MSHKNAILMIQKTYQTDVGTIEVKKLLGSGTQGEVYQVLLDQNEYALKIYYPNQIGPSLIHALEVMIEKGAPNPHFVWPKYLIQVSDHFGYIMPLIGKQYKKFSDWILRKFDMPLKDVIKSCLQLTEAFHQLHARGLSYQDISFNNMMLDPSSGDILIIDNDNVTTNSENNTGVYGTPGFMAPEIVERKTLIPNSDTDRFSLAVLLFNFLLIGHPFHGALEYNIKILDEEQKTKLYGFDAVFIFDPHNTSNRPVTSEHKGVIALWDFYPSYIQDIFIQAFTVGIKDPQQRPREKDFKKVFIHFLSNLYTCRCGDERLYDHLYFKRHQKVKPCQCGNEDTPSRMKIDDYIFILDHNKPLTDLYLNVHTEPDNTHTLLAFKKHKLEYKMKNFSSDTFTVKSKEGMFDNIKPDDIYILKNGDELNIKGHKVYVKLES